MVNLNTKIPGWSMDLNILSLVSTGKNSSRQPPKSFVQISYFSRTWIPTRCWFGPADAILRLNKIWQHLLVAPVRSSHGSPRIIVRSAAACVNGAIDARVASKNLGGIQRDFAILAMLQRLGIPSHSTKLGVEKIERDHGYSGQPCIVGNATLEDKHRGIWILAQSRSQDTSCSSACRVN